MEGWGSKDPQGFMISVFELAGQC